MHLNCATKAAVLEIPNSIFFIIQTNIDTSSGKRGTGDLALFI